ncbi:coiled-coil domain-containing protein 81-like [Anas acuta]|uniref:coiled-coil domain-containing protein 81-like n=1 Tax=Anas acuta TaxID=28680 RepID=UPI0035C89FAC
MRHYVLFNPLKPEDLSLIKELTRKEIAQVWNSTSRYIRRQLLQKKAVNIGIGTFAVVSAKTTGADGKAMVVRKPIFKPCRFMKIFYKLKCAESRIPRLTLFLHGCFLVETFIDPLDIEKIAAHIYFRPQIVEQCIHETLLLYAGGLLDNQDVEFFFKGIGILTVRRRVVTMNYYTDFLLDVDDTRNMREALLTNSKMMDMLAFDGKNRYTRISGNTFLTLPTLILRDPQRKAVCIKPRRDPQPWGMGGRRVSVLDPVVMARRRVSQAKRAEKKRKEEADKQREQARFLPPIHERSEEKLKKPTPSAYRRSSIIPACYKDTPPMKYFCQILKCTRVPTHIVRKEYDQMLKQRIKDKLKGQMPTSLKAPKGWQQVPQQPRTAQKKFLPPVYEESEEELKKPTPPAHPKPRTPEHGAFAQDTSTPGARSVRAKIEERRLRILKAHKMKNLEAETWNQYDSTLQKLMMEHKQKNFHQPMEHDQRPSFQLRMEYNEKLKERMNQNEKGQSGASLKAPEGRQEEPQPLRRAQTEFLPPIYGRSEEELKKPTPPAHPKPKTPECLDNPQDPPTSRWRSVRAQMEERRYRILMAHKRTELEDEIGGEYDAILRSRSRERKQNPVYHLLEGDQCPSSIVRREYDKKLKDRMRENVKGQSPASKKAPDASKEETKPTKATQTEFLPPIHGRSEEELKKPKPPAYPQTKPREHLSFAAQKTATSGVHYMRVLTEEKREQALMAHRLKTRQAEAWNEYDSKTQKLLFERRKNPINSLQMCDQRPSFHMRKEYDEKLKERMMLVSGRIKSAGAGCQLD